MEIIETIATDGQVSPQTGLMLEAILRDKGFEVQHGSIMPPKSKAKTLPVAYMGHGSLSLVNIGTPGYENHHSAIRDAYKEAQRQ